MASRSRIRRPALIRLTLSVLALVAGGLLLAGPATSQGGGVAYSVELTGTIDPATERWVDKAVAEAREKRAKMIILRLDTPGGLVTSMRAIIQDILGAKIPVVVYVSPDGARAASAGLFITQASDVAAMAPQTNIGSATPIQLSPGGGSEGDSTLLRKVENDAAAFVRALASEHGRDPELAEEMVRKATNVTARTALERNLIDLVADDEQQLLERLDGFEVKGPKARTLDTTGLTIERRDMPLQYDLLQLLVNPTIAFLLLAAGLAGIGFEIFNPGLIFPGAFGAVFIVLGAFATSLLPVTVAGIVLLVLALILMVAESQIQSHGALGAAGVASLVASGLLLFDTDSAAFDVSVPVVILTAVLLGGLTTFAAVKAVQARHMPVLTGWEELVGHPAEVRVPLDPIGQVFIEGALWRGRPTHPTGKSRGGGGRLGQSEGITPPLQ
ncbi:MAG: NfeD family protein, partial [Solirubrobacterales bacterium]